jgi:hypothetical protein
MSLTSYRTAPPRDPEMHQQDAAVWPSRKSFSRKMQFLPTRFEGDSKLDKYSLAPRYADSYFSMLLGGTHSSIG